MIKIGDIITKEMVDNVVNDVVQETAFSIKDAVFGFFGNYAKRRNVGFGPIKSITGAYCESRDCINAKLCGREYNSTKEAIIFEKRL